jgi:hypothetical protein
MNFKSKVIWIVAWCLQLYTAGGGNVYIHPSNYMVYCVRRPTLKVHDPMDTDFAPYFKPLKTEIYNACSYKCKALH